MYISTNEVEQKAMRNMQHSHIQCVTLRKIKGERMWYMYIYFHLSILPSSIANTCRHKDSCQTSLGVSAFYFDRVHSICAVPWQHPTPIKIPKSPPLGTDWELISPARSTPLHFLCLLRADDVFLGLDI